MRLEIKFSLLIIGLIATILIAVMYGSTTLTLANLGNDEIVNSIILQVRLPRVIVAAVVGACLSISGLIMQTLLKNPLASPYTLGVSSGAGLGASLTIISGFFFFGNLTITVVAFIFALLSSFLVLFFSKKIDKNISSETIVLTGIVLSLFLGAIISLLLVLSPEDSRRILLYMSGSLSMSTWSNLYVALPLLVIGVVLIYTRTLKLDILTFGDASAHSMGINVIKIKYEIIIVSSFLTAVAVSICGVIGFVGLVVPHITRSLFGSKHYITIIATALIGAIFLVLCDLVARTIAGNLELPVGAITALIGGPFFAFVFFKQRRS